MRFLIAIVFASSAWAARSDLQAQCHPFDAQPADADRAVSDVMVLLPAVIMSITPFLRITIVLHFLRQALGTQTVPSNQVLIGLALFSSLVIMQPVITDVYHKAWEPMDEGRLTAVRRSTRRYPIESLLSRFTREKTSNCFLISPNRLRRRILRNSAWTSSCLRIVRAENRFSDRRDVVSAVSGDRSGGRLRHFVDRMVQLPRSCYPALQDFVVRAGGRLEPGGRIAGGVVQNKELPYKTPESAII